MTCFRFPQKCFVAFHFLYLSPSLRFDFVFIMIFNSRPTNQPLIQSNNFEKKLTKSTANARVHFHTYMCICIEWRWLIRYCTVSILESWIKMIWNFDLQESRMTTFSLVVLPIFMKITTSLPVCAVRIVRELTFDESQSQSQAVDEALNERDNRKKNIKSSMLSNSVGGFFSSSDGNFPSRWHIIRVELSRVE